MSFGLSDRYFWDALPGRYWARGCGLWAVTVAKTSARAVSNTNPIPIKFLLPANPNPE